MCDSLCFRTSTGMVLAKNSDRPPSETQTLLAHAARPPGGLVDTQYLRIADPGAAPFVGSHPTWLWGAEHGVNEHGVAIGNEKIWTVDDPHALPPALLGMDLVRIGLERGPTADAARAAITSALTEHGQGGSGEPGEDAPYFSSFLVVEARGGWVIETSARTWAARPVGDGSSISNRIALSPDWRAADFRGITVCMHAGGHQATTAAMVVELRAGAPVRAWACLGSPCAGVFVPFFPPAPPTALSDPAQWQRFTRLRERVEADPDALPAVRRVLAPVEAELWTDADDCFATGEPAALAAFPGTASARVDAALEALGV